MKKYQFIIVLFCSLLSCDEQNNSFLKDKIKNNYTINFSIKDSVSDPFGGTAYLVHISDTNWNEMARFGEDLLCPSQSIYSKIYFYLDSTKMFQFGANFSVLNYKEDPIAIYKPEYEEYEVEKFITQKGVFLDDFFPLYYFLYKSDSTGLIHQMDTVSKCEINKEVVRELIRYSLNFDNYLKQIERSTSEIIHLILNEEYDQLKSKSINNSIDLIQIKKIRDLLLMSCNYEGLSRYGHQDYYNLITIYWACTNENEHITVDIEYDTNVSLDKFKSISYEIRKATKKDRERYTSRPDTLLPWE